MPVTNIDINAFLENANRKLILDVRSPGEYKHAHIPEAISLPLFTDEERKIIGTSYKQDSRESAIKIGLESFGKNMVKMVVQVELLLKERKSTSRALYIHCWRGGMRSASVSWLMDLYGFEVYLLNGGYKTYRKHVLEQFEKPYSFTVIGGYTGSDKTGLLHALKNRGEKMIDLEGLAQHKGSAFGNLQRIEQPSQEMFENLLATDLSKFTVDDNFWIEDENQRVGDINIPLVFFKSMREQPMLFIDLHFDKRLDHLVKTYSSAKKETYINAIIRIKKRLGGLETKTAISYILEDDMKNCFAILLKYYDKYYLKSSMDRDNAEHIITMIPTDAIDLKINTEKLLSHVGTRK